MSSEIEQYANEDDVEGSDDELKLDAIDNLYNESKFNGAKDSKGEDAKNKVSPDGANPYEKAQSTFSANLKKLSIKTQELINRVEQSQTQITQCQKDLAEKKTEHTTMKRQHENEIKQRESDELKYFEEMNELILKELKDIQKALPLQE